MSPVEVGHGAMERPVGADFLPAEMGKLSGHGAIGSYQDGGRSGPNANQAKEMVASS